MGFKNQEITALVYSLKRYVFAIENLDGIYDNEHKSYMMDLCDTVSDKAQDLKAALENR